MRGITTSLIVSTYNWPEALNVCLQSVKNQTVLPDELIIADDGSTDATKNVIDRFRDACPVPVIHVWQPDDGFQLSKIRNKAIAKSSQDYIIQVDGDLILHPQFISDHIKFCEHGSFVTGSRVLMDAKLSERVLKDENVVLHPFMKGITNISNAIRSRVLSTFLARRYKANDIFYMRGCNMAFWRKDLILVNGYNEEISGWGREDSEIAVRLMNAGVLKRALKFGAVVFHLYHNEFVRSSLSQNDEILTYTIESKKVHSPNGLNKY